MSLVNNPALWAVILFIVPLLLRVPIGISLGLASVFVAWHWDMGAGMASYNYFANIAKFPLLAIPFFILAGTIMDKASIAEKIVNLLRYAFGHYVGGLAIAAIGVAAFWGAVSGSTAATVAAIGNGRCLCRFGACDNNPSKYNVHHVCGHNRSFRRGDLRGRVPARFCDRRLPYGICLHNMQKAWISR